MLVDEDFTAAQAHHIKYQTSRPRRSVNSSPFAGEAVADVALQARLALFGSRLPRPESQYDGGEEYRHIIQLPCFCSRPSVNTLAHVAFQLPLHTFASPTSTS